MFSINRITIMTIRSLRPMINGKKVNSASKYLIKGEGGYNRNSISKFNWNSCTDYFTKSNTSAIPSLRLIQDNFRTKCGKIIKKTALKRISPIVWPSSSSLSPWRKSPRTSPRCSPINVKSFRKTPQIEKNSTQDDYDEPPLIRCNSSKSPAYDINKRIDWKNLFWQKVDTIVQAGNQSTEMKTERNCNNFPDKCHHQDQQLEEIKSCREALTVPKIILKTSSPNNNNNFNVVKQLEIDHLNAKSDTNERKETIFKPLKHSPRYCLYCEEINCNCSKKSSMKDVVKHLKINAVESNLKDVKKQLDSIEKQCNVSNKDFQFLILPQHDARKNNLNRPPAPSHRHNSSLKRKPCLDDDNTKPLHFFNRLNQKSPFCNFNF